MKKALLSPLPLTPETVSLTSRKSDVSRETASGAPQPAISLKSTNPSQWDCECFKKVAESMEQ